MIALGWYLACGVAAGAIGALSVPFDPRLGFISGVAMYLVILALVQVGRGLAWLYGEYVIKRARGQNQRSHRS